ncbi:MAG: PspC domain-containing protein [Candidatus Marinimicrobia bacterium]|nr:PspC domain-containing protein [Candidatus Neomarinimicrobiota bacterium]
MLFYRRKDLTAFFDKEAALPLHLSETDKKVAGVCGGIAESVNVDSNIIRLIWVFGTFMTAGTGAIIYFVLMIILPKATYSEVDE